MIKQGQQVRIEFNQQWLPMGISLGQVLSLSALSVRFSLGLSPLFKLFGALLLSPRSKTVISGLSPLFHLLGALMLSPRYKTVVSGLSLLFKLFGALLLPSRSKIVVCLLACSPFSCLLSLSLVFLRECLRFCSASRIHDKVFCCSEGL